MNVCQLIKIAPLVLLISACTSGSGSDSKLTETGDGGVSSALGSDDPNSALSTSVGVAATTDQMSSTSGSNESDTLVTNISSADLSSTLGTNDINVLSSSVGSVMSTDGQAGAVQPTVQPTEISPTVGTPTTPTANDAAQTPAEVDTSGSTAGSASVRIPRIDRPNAPIIDGETLDYIAGTEQLDGEWRFAAQFNNANAPLAISQYMFGEPGTNNDSASHHWAAVHDGEYLYLLVVSDDAGRHFQDTNEARKPWKDDSVEIYFDGNNSRLTQYDGVDDFHITINLFSSPGAINRSDIENAKIRQSDTSATLPSDLIFRTGPRKGPIAADVERGRKDIYEIRVKISELNIQVNTPFGFEVQINDDDNGNNRDSKWGWVHPEGASSDNDLAWENPSFMGTAILLQ